MKINDFIQTGTDHRHGSLWLALRDVARDLPEPAVEPDALVWDTSNYEVRIEVPDALDKLVTWEARTKGSGVRSSGRGNPIACPTLAMWIGRICGEATVGRKTQASIVEWQARKKR